MLFPPEHVDGFSAEFQEKDSLHFSSQGSQLSGLSPGSAPALRALSSQGSQLQLSGLRESGPLTQEVTTSWVSRLFKK